MLSSPNVSNNHQLQHDHKPSMSTPLITTRSTLCTGSQFYNLHFKNHNLMDIKYFGSLSWIRTTFVPRVLVRVSLSLGAIGPSCSGATVVNKNKTNSTTLPTLIDACTIGIIDFVCGDCCYHPYIICILIDNLFAKILNKNTHLTKKLLVKFE